MVVWFYFKWHRGMRSLYETSVVRELRVNDVVECSENSEQFNNR